METVMPKRSSRSRSQTQESICNWRWPECWSSNERSKREHTRRTTLAIWVLLIYFINLPSDTPTCVATPFSKFRASLLGESSGEEDLTQEVLRKVFENLPGTPDSVGTIINRASKPKNSELDAIHGKRIQLLGYDTCRRAAVDFMKNAVRETRKDTPSKTPQLNYPGFRLGTYSRNEPRIAHRRTGLLKGSHRKEAGTSYDQEIRDRMLKSLDLHLANKQRDYTAKLMRSGI